MPERPDGISRRSFLERVALGAGVTIAGGGIVESIAPKTVSAANATGPDAVTMMNAGAFGWDLNAGPSSMEPATVDSRPNILMLMVDQLRIPQLWLTTTQQQQFDQDVAPNIAALRQNAYVFNNFFVAAQDCTPSRATLLTGLYAPQTGVFSVMDGGNPAPGLSTAFPTFGNALQDICFLNPDNVLWFGKWHLSNYNNGSGVTDLMPSFGFNSGRSTQIQYPSNLGSPVGSANEGNFGYLNNGVDYLPCDAAILQDFQNNWSNYPPATPWFTCVSFVNPHDMTYYPGFFTDGGIESPPAAGQPGQQGNPYDPSLASPTATDDFLPGMSNPPASVAILGSGYLPGSFNWESPLTTLPGKSTDVTGTISDPGNFLQPWFSSWEIDAYCNYPNPHAPLRRRFPSPIFGDSSIGIAT
jgi:hypothetical protein